MKYEVISDNEIIATPGRLSRILGMKPINYITKHEEFKHFTTGLVWYNKNTGSLIHPLSDGNEKLNDAYRANEFKEK